MSNTTTQQAGEFSPGRDGGPHMALAFYIRGNDLADAYLSAYPRALAPGLRSADPQQVERCEALDARSDLKADWERTNAARKGRSSNAFRRGLERFEDASRVLALLRAVVYAVHPWPRWQFSIPETDQRGLSPILRQAALRLSSRR